MTSLHRLGNITDYSEQHAYARTCTSMCECIHTVCYLMQLSGFGRHCLMRFLEIFQKLQRLIELRQHRITITSMLLQILNKYTASNRVRVLL